MRILLPLRLSLLLLLILGSSACGSYQRKVSDNFIALQQGESLEASIAMQTKIAVDSIDIVQQQLNLGLLYHLNGDYQQSIQLLASAKREITRLQAISISENIKALAVNDTLRSFNPNSAERMLLYELQILNYLAIADLPGARVEALQAIELLQEYREDSSQLRSLYYLIGVVFELNSEPDQALVAYRQSYALEPSKAPRALEDALLLLTHQLGLSAEFAQYQSKFQASANRLAVLLDEHNFATWIGMYWQGMVAPINSTMVNIYVPELGHSVTLSQAVSGTPNYGSAPRRMSIAATPLNWQVLDDFQKQVNTAIQSASAANLARMVGRAISKHQISRALANSQDSEAGAVSIMAVFDIVNQFLEVADTRHFNGAPAQILISRQRVPTGNNTLQGAVPQLAFQLKAQQILFFMNNQYAKSGLYFSSP